jgi:hypothetical protein
MIPARTFPSVFYVQLPLMLCVDIGGLLSRNRPTSYELKKSKSEPEAGFEV